MKSFETRHELVELPEVDPTFRLDVRYATSDNFIGRAVYTEARAFLQKPAAEALLRVHRSLLPHGYGLLIFDGYRPWSVTKIFWDETPEEKRIFVANPESGSIHNRGCAIDLGLHDLETGLEVEMPSAFDEMTERSYANYPGGTSESRQARDLLRSSMEAQGYEGIKFEWWHFNFKGWRDYPVLNLAFHEIEPALQTV
ncbi:MAG: M15 family metallopeptidase [Methylotenera sp.]|nr:M15 family metallopeptidase [Oligoflexia bacterium]